MTTKYTSNRRPVIAIADIDQRLVDAISEELMIGDFEVSFKSSSADIQDLVNALPDIIILGVRLEGGSGFALLKKIRKHPVLKFTPIIMLTASGKPEEMETAFQLGAIDAVPKPIYPPALRMKITRFIEEFIPISRAKTEFMKHIQETVNRHTRRGHNIYCKHLRDFPSVPNEWDIPVPDLIVKPGKSYFVYEFVTMNDLLNPQTTNNWKYYNQFNDIHLRVCSLKEDENYLRQLMKKKKIKGRVIILDAKRRKSIRRRFDKRKILIVIIISISLAILLSLPMRNIYEYSKKWIHGVKEQYNKYEPFDLQRGDQFEDEVKKLEENKKELEPPPK